MCPVWLADFVFAETREMDVFWHKMAVLDMKSLMSNTGLLFRNDRFQNERIVE